LYLERFSVVKEGIILDAGSFFPDRIWVNDAIALREGAVAGLPTESIEIVGQPHLEWQLNQLLERIGGVKRKNEVVFISERVGADFCAGTSMYRGFNEFSVLQTLMQASDGSDCRLIVKLHPQEPLRKFDELLAGRSAIEVVKEADNVELIAGARFFIGMFSMLLLEAALVREDVLSFLPGGDPSIFIGNRVGATIPVTRSEELKSIIDSRFDEKQPVKFGATPFGNRFIGSKTCLADAMRRLVS
jgi:hypothetical protein